MIRSPPTDTDGKPELNEDEQLLRSRDDCRLEFGELQSNGSFYVTSQRLIFITNSNDSSNTNTCYSLSAPLIQLMVHALCKEATSPYLFMQLENQENELKLTYDASYEELTAIYEALCEGQRLNPCEDSDDGGDAVMGFAGNASNSENDNATAAEQKDGCESAMAEWESKLKLDADTTAMVSNGGYLQPAEQGQFDDADVDGGADGADHGSPSISAAFNLANG